MPLSRCDVGDANPLVFFRELLEIGPGLFVFLESLKAIRWNYEFLCIIFFRVEYVSDRRQSGFGHLLLTDEGADAPEHKRWFSRGGGGF